MSLAHLFKHIVDGLWALGGIGAAADLGIEYSGLEDCGPDWDALCPVAAHCENIPLEGELCKVPLLELLVPALVPLGLTLKVALTATAAACVLGIGAGFALSRRGLPGRELLDALCTLPLVLPPTVIGYYLLVLFGRRGVLGQWLLGTFGVSLVFTWQGAALAACVVAFPLVCKAARTAFEGVDQNLEHAARSLGAGECGVFLRVSLPLAWRGVLAGTMLALARAMGEFGATLMIAGNLPGRTQTLSLAVYEAVQAGRDNEALFLVLLTSLVCILLLLASGKFLKPSSTI